jgi:hypothetical protein
MIGRAAQKRRTFTVQSLLANEVKAEQRGCCALTARRGEDGGRASQWCTIQTHHRAPACPAPRIPRDDLSGRDEQRARSSEGFPMDIEQNARTQVLYREVNNHIRAIQHSFGMPESLVVMCECGRGCSLQLEVAATDYARVRDVSTYFLVRPEHQAPEVDHVVEDHGSWLLVEAIGVAADIARNGYLN